jgi:prolipoprotein diacylglyceryltransferase
MLREVVQQPPGEHAHVDAPTANGDVLVLYVSLYSVGRFFVETLRIDPAFIIGTSFRGNLLVSGVLAVGFALILINRPSRRLHDLRGM